MARFNKELFLAQEITESLDVARTLFPQGECVGQRIEEITIHEPKTYTDKDTNEEKEGSPQLELKILVREDHAERIRNELGYAADRPVYFTYRFYLDLDESGLLASGPNKNIPLGQVRAAVGQNEAGVPWSFSNLRGAGPIAFVVRHEKWEKNGKEGTSERVNHWAAADND